MYLNPEAADLLFDIGFHCIGCPMSMAETIEEGCMVHGMSKRDMNELLKRLNKKNGK
jgi:hydroxylamine reductase